MVFNVLINVTAKRIMVARLNSTPCYWARLVAHDPVLSFILHSPLARLW